MALGSYQNARDLSDSTPSPKSLTPYHNHPSAKSPWLVGAPVASRGRALPREVPSAYFAPGQPTLQGSFNTPGRAGNTAGVHMQTGTPESGQRLTRSVPGTQHLSAQPRQDRGTVAVAAPVPVNATTAGGNFPPRPHGTIGDRRLSPVREIVSLPAGSQPDSSPVATLSLWGSAPVRQPVVPVPGSHGRSSTAENHSLARSAADGGNTSPVYFQPMSSLVSTGLQYIPEPSDVGAAGQGAAPGFPTMSAVARLRPGGSTSTSSSGTSSSGTSSISPFTDVDRIAAGFSPRYMGDILLRNNQSEDIADDQNCSLFIVNLPPRLTTHELLAAIHRLGPTGRVYATHINGPEPARGHPGCAAKVVFFRRDVAHAFYDRCAALGQGQGGPGFPVGGHMARVMWNRIRTSERAHLSDSNASRVLLVAGPAGLVNERALADFFGSKLQFQTDKVLTHVEGGPKGEPAVVEFRFGSFRCQSQAAKLAIQRELPHVNCFFGVDPLEPRAWKPFEYYNFEGGF